MTSRLARIVAPIAVLGMLAAGGATALGKSQPAPAKPTTKTMKIKSGAMTVKTITDAGKKTTLPIYYATPLKPRALIVVFHGHGHNGDEWLPQLHMFAQRNRAIAVAMHTRETKDSKGPFNAVDEEARGAAAVIAAIQSGAKKPLPTYLLCVSMGCTGAAYLIDAATRPAAGDTDARWIQKRFTGPVAGIVVAEGLSNLFETYVEAVGFDQTAQKEIEYETRTEAGPATPTDNPAAYRSRSLALLPRASFTSFGIAQAAVIHPLNDGLVPVNQGVESRNALRGAGIPVHGYTVLSNRPTCSYENETTGTSHAGVPGLDERLCLAGHATETARKTPVMRATHDVLYDMVRGAFVPGESTVYPDAGAILTGR